MVGPALKQLHSHKAIHDGGLAGAIQKTEEFFVCLKQGKKDEINQALDDLIEYWKTRIISHADAEESGFYAEVIAQNASLQNVVTQLERDHELLRIIIQDLEEEREKNGINEVIIQKLYALITVNEIHSREEERLLF